MPTLCPSTQPSSHIIGVVVNGTEEVAGGVDQVIVVENDRSCCWTCWFMARMRTRVEGFIRITFVFNCFICCVAVDEDNNQKNEDGNQQKSDCHHKTCQYLENITQPHFNNSELLFHSLPDLVPIIVTLDVRYVLVCIIISFLLSCHFKGSSGSWSYDSVLCTHSIIELNCAF